MNIKTVAENLRRTIAGKEKYLAEVKAGGTTTVSHTIMHMLTINIDELKLILIDVEKCQTPVYTSSDDPLDGPMIKMFRD